MIAIKFSIDQTLRTIRYYVVLSHVRWLNSKSWPLRLQTVLNALKVLCGEDSLPI